jgi:flagellar hook-associated protein 1 FlgK
VYTAAQTLASTFNRTAIEITSQSASLNQQVRSSVDQANELTTQIASLNQQIGGASAGSLDTLLDERDQLVTQIAGLVDVNTVTGSNNMLGLTLSDGASLVSGSQATTLTTATLSGVTQIYATSGNGETNVTAAIHGGSIGGALQARDQDLPEVSSQLDNIAQAIAAAVNTQNASGVTALGTAGGDLFSGTTAATISVSATSAAVIAVSSTSGLDGNNVLAISNLQNSAFINGQTPSESFASLLSGLGQRALSASTTSSADAAVLTQSSTQRDAFSGVSLDQEAANLTQYQRSYEAAAKVLSIVDDLMAQAINLGTPTTVS